MGCHLWQELVLPGSCGISLVRGLQFVPPFSFCSRGIPVLPVNFSVLLALLHGPEKMSPTSTSFKTRRSMTELLTQYLDLLVSRITTCL